MSNYEFLHTPDPYSLTHQELIEIKLKMLQLKPGQVVGDLGVGDARSLITACQMEDVTGVGIELHDEALAIAQDNINQAGLADRITLVQQNFLDADVSKMDALHLYLTRTMLGALSLKLEEELPKGARIVTHEFDIPAWTSIHSEEITLSTGARHWVYVYEK